MDYDNIREIYEKYITPENLMYAATAITGLFMVAISGFFWREYKGLKKMDYDKRARNLEKKLNQR